MTQNQTAPLSIDRIFAVGQEDALNRAVFAEHLLDIAMRVDPRGGAVLGLEGAWGSGKSWVLKAMAHAAENRKEASAQPVVLQFNPWMVGAAGDLVEAFLLQLSSQLGDPDQRGGRAKIAKGSELEAKILDYTAALELVQHAAPLANLVVPGSGMLFQAAGYAFGATKSARDALTPSLEHLKRHPDKLSLKKRREAVHAALHAFDSRIIVMIDDLDRLPPNEIAEMVRALLAVADFPSVVYVLAYDPTVVAEALQQSLHIKDGLAYLEKIIQVPVKLPPPPARMMQAFGRLRIMGLLPPQEELHPSERRDLPDVVDMSAALLSTPRDVERFRAVAGIRLQQLRGRVNIGDLLLIEALQLKAPTLVEWMRDHAKLFIQYPSHCDEALVLRGAVPSPYSEMMGSSEERQKWFEDARVEWFKQVEELSVSLRTPVRFALARLFEQANHFALALPKRNDFRRLERFRQWYQWQCAFASQDAWPSAEIARMFQEPSLLLANGVANDIQDLETFFKLVADTPDDELSAPDPQQLLDAYRNIYDRHVPNPSLTEFFGPGVLAWLQRSLMTIEIPERLKFIESLMDDRERGVSAVIGLIMLMSREYEQYSNDRDHLVPDREIGHQYQMKYRENVLAALSSQAFESFGPGGAYMLWAIELVQSFREEQDELGQDSEMLRDQLLKLLRSHPDRLSTIFSRYSDGSGASFSPGPLLGYSDIVDLSKLNRDWRNSHNRLITECENRSREILSPPAASDPQDPEART